ncbi:MAG: hypothetical protein HDR94_00665 [Bacteroides sp.]|nr:hypothetical protein [Bacteroidales bacterium]MBD5340066.1 hypothetical protein [Bacteroides sp.]
MSELMKYDEDDAIKFIRETLPQEVSEKYSDDEILYVIDIIWDWYERNGYLKIDAGVTDEEELDVEKLTAFVAKEIKKDGEVLMDPQDIDLIVRGELQYEESIEDIF